MSAIIKDTEEIWARLFDHRAFLGGEIKYLLKEFEEKRGDREVERLFSILEIITDVKETQVDKLKLAADVHLPILNANLEVALSMCNRILENEEKHRQDTTLLEKRKNRKAEWENFIEDMTLKCGKVDATFDEKEEELKEFYSDLETEITKFTMMDSYGDASLKIQPSLKLEHFIMEALSSTTNLPRGIQFYIQQKLVDDDNVLLDVADIMWLHHYIKSIRNEVSENKQYLHDLLEGCTVKLPEPEKVERNPELEARIQKLKFDQAARDYRMMTKDVDPRSVRAPDESIAYQLKQINRQLIAVFQFIVSVASGFVFGFLGIQWIIGELDFGFRLLLGVMCALVIALAEIYFLAKKLNEEYGQEQKLHKD